MKPKSFKDAKACGRCTYWEVDYAAYDGSGWCEKYRFSMNDGASVCDDFEEDTDD